jgi:hypothetical protein
MNAGLCLWIIVEAPPLSALLPRALVETLALYPQRPEPVSSSEGTRTVGRPPREYSTVMVRFEPTTSCLHERILCRCVNFKVVKQGRASLLGEWRVIGERGVDTHADILRLGSESVTCQSRPARNLQENRW